MIEPNKIKPIKATTIVEGKYAHSVIKQANTTPSENFKKRSNKAVSLLRSMKG